MGLVTMTEYRIQVEGDGFLTLDDQGNYVPCTDPNQALADHDPLYLVADTAPQAVTSGNWPEGWTEVGSTSDNGTFK
jgi:hypothetical protein